MLNIASLLVLLLLAGLFFSLAFRASRARRAWIKWPGMLLSGLFGMLLLVITGVAAYGEYQLNVPPYSYTVADVKVAGTPEQIARGQQLAYICLDCHSSTGDLPLDGGKANLFAGGPPAGVLYGANLTPAGPLADWSDGEIIRAIREGVDKNGRPLFGMTSEPFSHLSDDDAQALVAFLRSQPAVERDLPERSLNILSALFVGAGLAPTSAQPPLTGSVDTPAAGTVEYGRYLVYTSGCRDCHGPDLTGGTSPLIPNGPSLIAAMPAWNEDAFHTFFRSGVNYTGRGVEPAVMPWNVYAKAFSDGDLKDMYNYLSSLTVANVKE